MKAVQTYKLRNGSSHAADRFRLAMAIVQGSHELSPEVLAEATALAKRLESLTIPAMPRMPRSRDEVPHRHGVKARG